MSITVRYHMWSNRKNFNTYFPYGLSIPKKESGRDLSNNVLVYTNGVYKPKMERNQQLFSLQLKPICDTELLSSQCEEGCYCPNGTRLHEGKCIPQEECPCYLRAKAFQTGQKVAKDCNTCECANGKWVCTEVQCSARCEAIGDPHYQTFDGRRYNFMGKCSYYLLHTDNYTVEAENVACDGRISQNMGFSLSTGFTPSCTRTVTIRMGKDQVLRLKQHKEISVNNEDVENLPVVLAGAYVRAASSMFVQVEMPDGVEVWWDGQTRVYITAPPALKGKTKGLCGTFNGNQKDDFLTPEDDVEQEPSAFADKWRTRETCENSATVSSDSHPCDKHVQNRAVAESYCSNITSNLFADCHYLVDPAPYYEDCLYDVCSCNGRLSECLCPVIAAYAKQCTFQGATIDWRDKVVECEQQKESNTCFPYGVRMKKKESGRDLSHNVVAYNNKVHKLEMEGNWQLFSLQPKIIYST
ncbi:hypothetical protein J6590_104214 [Homalodisca vitripennis]|nr:hypothetical protein J6590_104214 [Homalodisca vitripennis]